MRVKAELQLVGEPQDLRFDSGRIDREDRVTATAQQVMVMAFVTERVSMTAVEVNPSEHAMSLEKIEGAVHRSASDTLWMDVVRQRLRVDHATLIDQCAHHDLTRPRHTLAGVSQATQEPVRATQVDAVGAQSRFGAH
jgi:hypothetical protein